MDTNERVDKCEENIEKNKEAVVGLKDHFNSYCDRRATAQKEELTKHIGELDTQIVKLHSRVDSLRNQMITAWFAMLLLGLGLLAWTSSEFTARDALRLEMLKTINTINLVVHDSQKDIHYLVDEVKELKAELKEGQRDAEAHRHNLAKERGPNGQK